MKKFNVRTLNFINRKYIGPLVRKLYKIFGIKKKYKILNINSEAIGHFALDVALFLIEKDLKNYSFTGVLLAPRETVSNVALSKIWANYSSLIVVENRLLCFCLEYLKYYDDTNYDCTGYTAVHGQPPKLHDIFYTLSSDEPLIFWDKKLLKKASILFDRNYPEIDKNNLVAFHARDDYFDKKNGNPNLASQNHRNSELGSYQEIFSYLKTEGYSIFRIGAYQYNNISPNLDYLEIKSLNKFEKDLLELYIISICKLFLGSASGPLNLAIIWRKPLFALNMLPYAELRQVSVNSMVVPKLLKKDNKLLTLKEIFDNNFHLLNKDVDYVLNGIEPISNSPIDCMDDFKEFYLAFVKNNTKEISRLIKYSEQKKYIDLCQDSYDHSAKGLIPRHFFIKNNIL